MNFDDELEQPASLRIDEDYDTSLQATDGDSPDVPEDAQDENNNANDDVEEEEDDSFLAQSRILAEENKGLREQLIRSKKAAVDNAMEGDRYRQRLEDAEQRNSKLEQKVHPPASDYGHPLT